MAAKLDAVKGYLHHLNLPLPPEQIKLESIVQTVLTRARAFIYAKALGLIKGFTYLTRGDGTPITGSGFCAFQEHENAPGHSAP